MITLSASGLAAARGGELVVPPQSFTLASGDALAVTGENGAGKSTLLRVLAGLLLPAAGSLSVAGATGPDDEPAERVGEVAHYLGHRNAMKPSLSAADNLRFWKSFLGGGGHGVDAALDAVGLAGLGDLPVGYLSAGQQRRSALARLLVARRPIWLLDEPTAALDAGSQGTFARLAAEHLAGGGILVAATHQPLGIEARELRLRRGTARSGPTRNEAAALEAWL